MTFIWIIYGCLVAFCVFGLVCSSVATIKRKKLQNQADYNFKTKKGNYQFYYSVKGFKRGTETLVKIFTEPVLGFSDIKNADTNSFEKIKVLINDFECLPKVETKGLKAMGEISIPSKYIVGGKINANFTIKTYWFLGGNDIEDTLTFEYGKRI